MLCIQWWHNDLITLGVECLICDMKASTYYFYAKLYLAISTLINTSMDGTDRHLLSIIQALLEAAWLHARHLLSAQACINLDIFDWALVSPKGMCISQPRTMLWNNTVSRPGSLWASDIIVLMKTKKCYSYVIMSVQVSNSFQYFMLIPLPHMNNIMSISIYKELQTY